MSLKKVPLQVRVTTDRGDFDITGYCRGVRYRHAIPGGFASVQTSFDRPLAYRPDLIQRYAPLRVYDTRDGSIVAEGRVEDPERAAGDSGEIWGLTAIGGMAHASDFTGPYVAVDNLAESWIRADNTVTKTYMQTQQDSKTALGTGWRLSFERGKTVPVGNHGGIEYRPIREALFQKIGRISYTYDVDNSDTNWRHRLFMVDGGGNDNPVDLGFNSGGGSLSRIVQTDWANGRDRARLQMARNTSSVAITTDDGNVWFSNIVLQAVLKAVDGTDRLPTGSTTQNYAYSTDTLLAEDIIRDLLGRRLTKFDGANATIAASTYGIDLFRYIDGADAAAMMNDLMGLEPNTYWAAWESNSAGKYRFEWTTWPTTVDLLTSTVHGFDSPGSSDELLNVVNVRYRDGNGKTQWTQRTQSVAELTAAGLTRAAMQDMGEEVGTPANSAQFGDNFLAQRITPPNRGRLVVKTPVASLSRGMMLSPHELRPGVLTRVLDVEPSLDALNTVGRDGTTVFRVVSTDYDSDSDSVTLELDSYARSSARALADIQNSPALTRRRI